MLRWDLITNPEELERLRPGWDELASRVGRPFMLSGWLLAWWRHLRAPTARLRTVAVFDGDALVGIAPFFVRDAGARWLAEHRMLGIGAFSGLEPLAVPGFN